MYYDTEGNRTIGAGFNLERQSARAAIEKLGYDYRDVINGEVSMADEQLDILFDIDLGNAVMDACLFATDFESLPLGRRVVITDMAFNLGRNKLFGFKKMRDAIEDGNWIRASLEMQNSKWADQVGRRADRNMHGMLTGELLWD